MLAPRASSSFETKPPLGRVADARKQGILVAVGLQPEEIVHDLGCLDQQHNHLFLAFIKGLKVGRQANRGVYIKSGGLRGKRLCGRRLRGARMGRRRCRLDGRRPGLLIVLAGGQ